MGLAVPEGKMGMAGREGFSKNGTGDGGKRAVSGRIGGVANRKAGIRIKARLEQHPVTLGDQDTATRKFFPLTIQAAR